MLLIRVFDRVSSRIQHIHVHPKKPKREEEEGGMDIGQTVLITLRNHEMDVLTQAIMILIA